MLGLAFACCAPPAHARDFDPAAVRALEVGRTTREEVAASLGEPFSKGLGASGRETWIYVYPKLRSGPQPTDPADRLSPRRRDDVKAEILTLEFDGGVLGGIECGTSNTMAPQT
jgi:outer membrane protein assembly factor BamE (lipoprotein component of BamABCDE complex)